MSKYLLTLHISTSFLTHIYKSHHLKNIKPSMLTLPEKKYNKLCYQIYYYKATVGVLILFPSMASFFLRQTAQRKGPSHGFDDGEKKGPEFTDKPSDWG